MSDLRSRMEAAAEAAWQAGRQTLRWFQAPIDVESKADETPVTRADRETERWLVDWLTARFPKDGVLGEEHGERAGSSGYRWIVDPIDGTKSFIRGVPLYAVLLGLEDPSGESVVGAVAIPALGDLVVAARGEGCWWNSRRARVSELAELGDACVVYTGEECFEQTGTEDVHRAVRERVRVVRGWGDAYGHLLVATGRAEAMLDPILGLWDVAPLLPIVEEAGGVFTDWTGRRTIHGASGISTNRALARAVRELIPGCDPSGDGSVA